MPPDFGQPSCGVSMAYFHSLLHMEGRRPFGGKEIPLQRASSLARPPAAKIALGGLTPEPLTRTLFAPATLCGVAAGNDEVAHGTV